VVLLYQPLPEEVLVTPEVRAAAPPEEEPPELQAP
jgi:hypothetical protein